MYSLLFFKPVQWHLLKDNDSLPNSSLLSISMETDPDVTLMTIIFIQTS